MKDLRTMAKEILDGYKETDCGRYGKTAERVIRAACNVTNQDYGVKRNISTMCRDSIWYGQKVEIKSGNGSLGIAELPILHGAEWLCYIDIDMFIDWIYGANTDLFDCAGMISVSNFCELVERFPVLTRTAKKNGTFYHFLNLSTTEYFDEDEKPDGKRVTKKALATDEFKLSLERLSKWRGIAKAGKL